MKRNLPPLNALRVFEVAARLESFSQTADILCVTQSAVSKQIRVLEEHIGAALFERQGGVVKLTVEGRQYLSVVAQAFDIIELGSERFYREQAQEILTINIMPSLSSLWMFSRVDSFHQLHPDITLHIDSADDVVDWSQKKADAAIRCLDVRKKHSDAELLLKETLYLIASPKLLDSSPINAIADLQQHKLLSLNNRPALWSNLFQQYQLDTDKTLSGFGCEHFYMVIQATLEGFGIALAPSFLCADLLQQGKLVNPLALSLHSDYGYYFMSPNHKKEQAKVIKFKEWITEQLTL